MKLLYISFIILMALQGCYMSKTVHGAYSLKINNDFTAQTSAPDESKYIDESKKDIYKDKLIEGIRNELTTYGVTVVEGGLSDYELKITSFRLTESVSTSTVDDSASQYNGQTYDLHSCDASVDFELYKDGSKKGDWYAGVSKDEKLTNNRSFFDYIFGTNKDNSDYRHKELESNVFEDLSERAGRRTAARITKKISK